ncbi:hypothetical protein KF840_02695 [bacterium]|nr:hypothetical protein [bacterium]
MRNEQPTSGLAPRSSILDPLSAWESVRTAGLLLSPSRLTDVFPPHLEPLPWKTVERLRRAIASLDGAGPPPALLDVVLEEVLGLGRPLEPETGHWLKGGALGSEWTHRALSGEAVRPQRVWQGTNGAELPLFVDRERRLGIGRGRRMPARVVEWLRAGERSLALLTNGWQWRLIHASLDADAFAEWDVGLWFEEGEPGAQVTALRALLDRERLTPPVENMPAPLLAAIAASRKGQGELSAALGERVRQAVELLIQRVFRDAELPNGLAADEATRKQIYRAATRVVMRMVVVLFAEARDDLLPRGNPVYHLSYGLQGLREALQQAGAGTRDGLARLAHRHAAWPRVLALFRLIYDGSPHKDLTLIRYGGGLFEPGEPASDDPLRRALAALEDPARGPHDADVYRMLDLLCVTEMRLRQGAGWKRVNVPVDFSDLSSEYIGILYEGLLDYELRRAAANDPIVFLALGDQPALPLSRLEGMSDKALGELVEKLKAKAEPPADEEADDEDDGEADADVEGDDDTAAEEVEEAADETADEPDDARQAADERAQTWARRAVEAGKLVRKPKSKNKETLEHHAAVVAATARSLIARIVLPGEWFLVRWGGTRKGAGTFYTRPGLAVPTVQRTLRPLAFDPPAGADGRPDQSAPAAEWTPCRPEEILALKVCDPAMGSASFLVASLRFLTDALYQSLHHHGRIAAQGEHTLVTLAEGRPSTGSLGEETLPCRPDTEDFEPRLRAVLKRYVVERCLYGVDLDPLAVELGRLALWIETLDRDLPFEFLDHKLKVGNALVGCWFDRFRDYPVLAWNREGGDKTHANGVHFAKEGWTRAIKAMRDGVVKRELVELISRQLTFDDHVAGRTPEALHDEAAAALETMHAMGVADGDRRSEVYREHLGSRSPLQALRAAFDAWCALWFWPADRLDLAPTPRRLHALSDEQRAVVAELWRELRFFHWELEFPDVFCREREMQSDAGAPPHAGFDAIVGNPPWETLQPNSKEFFSNRDPLYRTYGKQEALRTQTAMFEAARTDERDWLAYNAGFKAYANWNKCAGSPFGDGSDDGESFSFGPDSKALHVRWAGVRGGRRSYADPRHAFRHQGDGKPYTYKMFLEQAHALMCPGGHVGMIVPSGLYTDKGSTELRRLFLEQCRWQWLFGFENRLKIFDIDSRFKFCPVIVRKGGATEAIRAAFMRHELADWAEAERHVIPYGREQVARFSPRTRAILEIRQKRDLEVLEKIYANSVLLGDDSENGWGIEYAQGDFNMTSDSKLFPPRPWWEERGYVPDEYGRWIKFKGRPNPKQTTPAIGWIRLRDGSGAVDESDIEDIALPLYEGRMIGQFDFSQKGWVSGKGRKAVWEEFPWSHKRLQPQYLMSAADYRQSKVESGLRLDWAVKLAFMDITSATNARTMIASTIPDLPCGNSAPLLRGCQQPAALAAILDSVTYDFVARARCGGLHLNYFVIEETPLPHPASVVDSIALTAGALSTADVCFAPTWMAAGATFGNALRRSGWPIHWALTEHERSRRWCIVDALAAFCFGLSFDDLSWLLRDCDLPAGFEFKALDPKGFWRTDKSSDPEIRRTVLTLVAFRDLDNTLAACAGDRDRAIAAFCGTLDPALVPDLPFLDPASGWQLPETLRLADYGLGHDQRAKEPQPVRARLGERFLPWQLEQSPEESWKDCEIHARNILGEAGFATLQAELRGEAPEVAAEDQPTAAVAEQPAQYGLFGPGSAGGRGRSSNRRGER